MSCNNKSCCSPSYDQVYLVNTGNYDDLTNKPTINGVTVEGDKTSQDFHITGEMDESVRDALYMIVNNLLYAYVEDNTLCLDRVHLDDARAYDAAVQNGYTGTPEEWAVFRDKLIEALRDAP